MGKEAPLNINQPRLPHHLALPATRNGNILIAQNETAVFLKKDLGRIALFTAIAISSQILLYLVTRNGLINLI